MIMVIGWPTREISVNTDDDQQVKKLEARVCELEEEIKELRKGESSRFSLESIASDDSKVAFYIGFPDYLKICFEPSSISADIQRFQKGT